jgi:hypothetical protein
MAVCVEPRSEVYVHSVIHFLALEQIGQSIFIVEWEPYNTVRHALRRVD